MNEKPEALRLAENLENPWHALMVSSRLLPGVDPLIVGSLRLDAAIELRRQHAEIERLKADNERLRGLLTDASKAVWMNYDGDLLDRIEAALKEVPR